MYSPILHSPNLLSSHLPNQKESKSVRNLLILILQHGNDLPIDSNVVHDGFDHGSPYALLCLRASQRLGRAFGRVLAGRSMLPPGPTKELIMIGKA